MKYTVHVPTTQFGFIEAEASVDSDEIESIIELHNMLFKAYSGEKAGLGLPPRDWCMWLDNYLITNTGNADQYNQMSSEQQRVIQEIKKSVKRLKTKTGEPEID